MSDEIIFDDQRLRKKLVLTGRIQAEAVSYIVATDDAGRIALCDPALGDRLGYASARVLIGKPLAFILGSAQSVETVIAEVRSSGRPAEWLESPVPIARIDRSETLAAVRIGSVDDAERLGLYETQDIGASRSFATIEIVFVDDLPFWMKDRIVWFEENAVMIQRYRNGEIIMVPNTDEATRAFMEGAAERLGINLTEAPDDTDDSFGL